MTYQDDFTLPTELLEQVAEQGLVFNSYDYQFL